jgi:hypothetical protein
MSTPVTLAAVVHPALARLVDERERAEPANPLIRRRPGLVVLERVQRVGDRDRSRFGHHDAGAEGEGEQIPQRYRAFGVFERPARIGEHGHVRQFREELVDRIVEAERAVLDERHRAGGDDRLRHRAGPADRVGCHRRPRASAREGQIARCLDVDLAVAGDDGDRTWDVAGVDVTNEHVSHAGQPFRREATGGHSLLLILSVYPGAGWRTLAHFGTALSRP